MAYEKLQEKRSKEQVEEDMTEEAFLKDLYLFMKKRDTPIERIPHLGFKQIDLFVMYKTVKESGGYHQVTSQQLWKQVYNTLGGNPRSTSAATCTRRHYEKLLLPYECHVKGELMNALPQHQAKHFHYDNFSRDDDGQRPAKRKALAVPLHQNPHNFLSDPHVRVIPLPVHYPQYYHPGHPVLPPYVPVSSSVLTPHSPPVPQPQFSYHPAPQSSTERIKQPLEHLRYLAEQYKSSSGLSEPLNLSFKASSPETNSNPASSFTPPTSGKNPKFLNKPSPLYPPKRVMRNEERETQDNEAAVGGYHSVKPYSYPLKAREGNIINRKSTSTTSSSSPTYASAPILRTDTASSTPLVSSREGTSTMTHIPSSPHTDFTVWPREEREGSPKLSQRALSLSHVLPSPPRENGGKMEIEIPLALLHDWIRLCGPSATMHGPKQLPTPTQEENTRRRSCHSSDIFPTNLTVHSHPREQDMRSATEDRSPRQRNVPSPTPNIQTPSDHHINHCRFSNYKPLPSGSILKHASRDVYPWDQQDITKPYSSKPINGWDPYDRDSQAPPIQLKMDSSPLTTERDFVGAKSSAYNEDTPQGGKERSGKCPSAVLMVNSSSASLLHLTSEEVMKLKRIISSSS
ncbi:AT-rich interaction domain 6 [Centroberyx gerrardi]|uniref:AT-rich interaction domain 6 n=1 Tax=Centroberyx gerrardi TaxID=166262 RepID=UPI003AB0F8CA